MNIQRTIFGLLFAVIITTVTGAAKLDKNTIAMLEGKEMVSAGYFKDIRNRIKNDPIEKFIRSKNFEKNFNSQVLRIIAENYILWKEAKQIGLHHRGKFKARFLSSLQSYFAEYITTDLVKQGAMKKNQRFDKEKLYKHLIKTYKLQVGTRNVNFKKIFAVARKSPSLDLYKPLPSAKFTPYEKFKKKEAEKYNVASYRLPGKKARKQLNLRMVLEKLPDYDYYKFRSATYFERDRMLTRIICGDLIPVEFGRLSKKDKSVREYVRRIEQITLARFYRMVRGLDSQSNYSLSEKERMLEPVSLTNKEMREYYDKNKDNFKRPRTAEAWMLRLPLEEVEDGDIFIEHLKDIEADYEQQQKVRYDLEDKRGRLVQRKRVTRNKKSQAQIEKEIKAMNGRIAGVIKKMNNLAREIPRRKFDRFQKKINELNRKENRRNGKVPKSSYLGRLKFDTKGKMKRWEALAFAVPTGVFDGMESILFNTGEGDYAILFVKNAHKSMPPFEDSMVQKKIRNQLSIKKRKRIVRQILNKGLRKVLHKKHVNWALLRKI